MNFLIFDVLFQTSFWIKLFDPLVITFADNKHCVKKDLKVWDKPQLSGMIKSFANDLNFFALLERIWKKFLSKYFYKHLNCDA